MKLEESSSKETYNLGTIVRTVDRKEVSIAVRIKYEKLFNHGSQPAQRETVVFYDSPKQFPEFFSGNGPYQGIFYRTCGGGVENKGREYYNGSTMKVESWEEDVLRLFDQLPDHVKEVLDRNVRIKS